MYIKYNKKYKTFEFPIYKNGALVDSVHNILVWNPQEENYLKAGFQNVEGPEPPDPIEGYAVQIKYSVNKKGVISYIYVQEKMEENNIGENING